MSTQDIIARLPRLSAEERARIAEALRDLTLGKETETALTNVAQPRVAGLHAGAWTVADDFDEPLPDEFWLGSKA